MSTYEPSEASASTYTHFTAGSMMTSRSPSTAATEPDELDVMKLPSPSVSSDRVLRARVLSESALVVSKKRARTASANPIESQQRKDTKRLKMEDKKAVSI